MEKTPNFIKYHLSSKIYLYSIKENIIEVCKSMKKFFFFFHFWVNCHFKLRGTQPHTERKIVPLIVPSKLSWDAQ